MFISIVMPSLNQGHFIECAIKSVLEQDYPNIELIVIDGGSTDETTNILEQLSIDYGNRLLWFSKPDNGPSSAINRALTIASGEVIGWLNSDDEYAPTTIANVADEFQNHEQWVMLYGKAKHIDEVGREIGDYPTIAPPITINDFKEGCFICQPTVFFKRSILAEVGKLNETLKTTFDFDFWIRVLRQFPDRIGFIDQFLAFSRIHADCITRTKRQLITLESMRLIYENTTRSPHSWFLSHCYEIIAAGSHGSSSKEIQSNINQFYAKAKYFLSPEDQERAEFEIANDIEELILQLSIRKIRVAEKGTHCRLPWIFLTHTFWLDFRLLCNSNYFNKAWYLEQYGRKRMRLLPPAVHYLIFGAHQGYNPSPLFDTQFYLSMNPDVYVAGVNPLIHYLRYGHTEQRFSSATVENQRFTSCASNVGQSTDDFLR